MADEEEDRVGLWLLKHLQEGVGRILVEFIDRVDDHDTPWRKRGAQVEELTELADLLYRDVLFQVSRLLVHQPLEPPHVWMAPRLNQLDDRMLVIGLERRPVEGRTGGFGEDAPCSRMGEARLADALRAGEKPGMVEPARRPCARKLSDRSLLAEDHGSRVPTGSTSIWGASSDDPDASISLTRSGPSAAMMWNAASTLR